MSNSPHTFSIPVMGTGHSIDSPIRVAHFGIDSVMSIVDDLLVERIRKYYCKKFGFFYKNIGRTAEDGRARRITAYLNTVKKIVEEKFEIVKTQPFFKENDKAKYFELLPDSSDLKKKYEELLKTAQGTYRNHLSNKLTHKMQAGSIDVNIMSKVDRVRYDEDGNPMDRVFSDASAALRGFALSDLSASIVLSAGFNPRLYNYISEFKDFYRDKKGEIKKKIILKVSDFRSAFVQGKYLAKKGLEVYEYRIESGLNCGGHAFPSDGRLLPTVLKEFNKKRAQLTNAIQPLVEKFYNQNKKGFSDDWKVIEPRLTVQGGIGVSGEAKRLSKDFKMNATGWGSPFLLVPEATTVDKTTRALLQSAQDKDLYISDASPFGVPFNNIRNSGSHKYHQKRIEKGKPGSPCPKNYLKSNTEFTKQPICTASTEYQLLKLDQINNQDIDEAEKEKKRKKVLEKACLCDHLANGALIALGIYKEKHAPQAICPGPNIAWFNREYSLREMIDHIYGRGESLIPAERPHMFGNEIKLYVDYFEQLVEKSEGSDKEIKELKTYKENLEDGMDFCLEIAQAKPYRDENLDSISPIVKEQRQRLQELFNRWENKSVTV